jgi:hypothetical protein
MLKGSSVLMGVVLGLRKGFNWHPGKEEVPNVSGQVEAISKLVFLR